MIVSPVRNIKKLSQCLKPANTLKKSPLSLMRTARKGNILAQMTSTTVKRGYTNHYQESLVTNTKMISVSDQDISGISPLVNDTRTGVLDITAKNETKKVVQRKHVRSPVINNKVQRKTNSFKADDFEKQLKKKHQEVLALNRKINKLEESLSEKNKIIKDLEIKFPKMLSEMSRGLGKDPDKLKVNIELKETIKRNRQLSGSHERNEKLLKVKDDKIKFATIERDKALDELKIKEREVRELKASFLVLEQKIPHFVAKLDDRETEIRKIASENCDVKYKLKVMNEENIAKMIELEKLSSEIIDLQIQIDENELEREEISTKLQLEASKVINLKDEVKNLKQELAVKRFRSSLPTLTEDNVHEVTNNEEEEDEVFEKMNIDEYQGGGDLSTASSIFTTDSSTMSESEYDISVGTLAKAEELDEKVRAMWTRLSSRDEALCQLHNNHKNFGMSVTKLKSDLSQSMLQNNTFHDNVTSAKKLFF